VSVVYDGRSPPLNTAEHTDGNDLTQAV
jgi:hypothetical protein